MAEIPDAEGRIQEGQTPLAARLDLDEDHPRRHLDEGEPEDRISRLLVSIVGTGLNVAVLLGIAFALASFLVALGFVLILLQMVVYVWLLFAYLSYRQGRQEELLQVLTTAVDAGAPLPDVLRAYLYDRPHGRFREFLVAAGLFVFLPGYYWIWYRWYNYDRLVERLASQLEQGVLLHEALKNVPGLATRETILAAAVGQSTGKLALCLRYATRPLEAELWSEIVPRLLYPVGLFIYISLVVSFWTVYLLPKMERIFKDFQNSYPDAQLPTETVGFLHFWPWLNLGFWLALLAGLFLFVFQFSYSAIRWYFPVVGWFHRKWTQSRVLQMLGVLLDTGKPVPESLALLGEAGYFRGIALGRLDKARQEVAGGEPLAASLARTGLLPASMAPLVQAAERIGNLPSTLVALGEHLVARLTRLLRRISQVLFPISVLAIGWLVYHVALSIFLPLVRLIEVLVQ